MIASRQLIYISPEEYLELEEKSPIKHEYIDGEIYAMAGASDRHITIALNIASELRHHLKSSGCGVYISDMKLQIKKLNRFYYPDVMVTSNQDDKPTENYKRFPSIIIEILSPSTEDFDRGDKFSDYQQIPTLQEYVLISTKKNQVDIFKRHEKGLWILQSY
ncbi:MAG TPA: Uma2 family endonuclease, partial [Allocoleopsis sp.]